MVCCAFAVFLFSQIYTGWIALRGVLFRREATPVESRAASWRPGVSQVPVAMTQRGFRVGIAIAIGAGGLLVVCTISAPVERQAEGWVPVFTSFCGHSPALLGGAGVR